MTTTETGQEDGQDGEATGAEIITLADRTPPATTSPATDVHTNLHELHRLLLLRLIEAVQEPGAKASMLNVARQFLFDNRAVLEDHDVPAKSSTVAPPGMARVAAVLMAMRDGGTKPSPEPPSELDGPPFNPPEDDRDADF